MVGVSSHAGFVSSGWRDQLKRMAFRAGDGAVGLLVTVVVEWAGGCVRIQLPAQQEEVL